MAITNVTSRICRGTSRSQIEGSAHNGIKKVFYRVTVVREASFLFISDKFYFFTNAKLTNNSRYLSTSYAVFCKNLVVVHSFNLLQPKCL